MHGSIMIGAVAFRALNKGLAVFGKVGKGGTASLLSSRGLFLNDLHLRGWVC